MKTREQIQAYLMLDIHSGLTPEDFELVMNTAEQIEQEYEEELLEQSVGYGLLCDYENNPALLEDCEIEKIAIVNGIVIYKKLEVK